MTKAQGEEICGLLCFILASLTTGWVALFWMAGGFLNFALAFWTARHERADDERSHLLTVIRNLRR